MPKLLTCAWRLGCPSWWSMCSRILVNFVLFPVVSLRRYFEWGWAKVILPLLWGVESDVLPWQNWWRAISRLLDFFSVWFLIQLFESRGRIGFLYWQIKTTRKNIPQMQLWVSVELISAPGGGEGWYMYNVLQRVCLLFGPKYLLLPYCYNTYYLEKVKRTLYSQIAGWPTLPSRFAGLRPPLYGTNT
jgi:hypothetical protein